VKVPGGDVMCSGHCTTGGVAGWPLSSGPGHTLPAGLQQAHTQTQQVNSKVIDSHACQSPGCGWPDHNPRQHQYAACAGKTLHVKHHRCDMLLQLTMPCSVDQMYQQDRSKLSLTMSPQDWSGCSGCTYTDTTGWQHIHKWPHMPVTCCCPYHFPRQAS
jgi:hypothetical protein